jgi:endonuclease/exonuclease/phosphatase family metal-dependent hydrolase
MAHSVKVMSFNIRYGTADDGENGWKQRRALVIARIRAFDPDLLGLQECRDDAQAAYVRRNLAGYQLVGVHRGGDDGSAIEMAPVLYRRSAFEAINHGHFWLSQTPQIPGSKSWGSQLSRTVTWVELRHRVSGLPVVFANTHFDYASEAAIRASARLLLRWVKQAAAHSAVIVTGDFNASKDSPAYRHLTGSGWLWDVFRQVHPAGVPDETYHGYGAPGAWSSIDWILATKDFQAVDAAIDTYRRGGRYPSDHFPLWAMLQWAA